MPQRRAELRQTGLGSNQLQRLLDCRGELRGINEVLAKEVRNLSLR
jgi:hypothetical protein